ncbi:Protein kinase domain protein [Kalmanozyma brasiliensis GHG001]|uniref:Protein kinase domain protein n=1 Tax=Kalmanozyma brasiliensis (strain GHG001) TaxID=1365824 RepID=UPI002867CA5E|nr:Protein kinase domain protein [Kalmanozyma brasiliensis GHG001]EST05663.2 Protein kinase domain protein [Kalmanozyma brasiliensis GHG001]
MAQVASASEPPLAPLHHHGLLPHQQGLRDDLVGLSIIMQAATAPGGLTDGASTSYRVPHPPATHPAAFDHASASLRPPETEMPTTAASLMREGPRDFTVIKDVGDGSFGTVCLADWKSPLPSGTMLSPMQHPTTRPEYIGKRLVAIKKMKKPFPSWQECMKLKELSSLLTIPPHPNIIPLYDAFLMPTTKELHFVFECMEGNLYQLTKSRKGRPLAAGLVASIYEQIVLGLDHIHQHGYFHRDMKPENLLITTTGLADYPNLRESQPSEKDVLVIVKLADFGLARETDSKPPYTEYVSTRWYRAPEVLLRSRDYSNPVDMWALGTILAELVNLKPLFPGHSEVDQVLQICDILGDPSNSYGIDSRSRRNGGGPWDRGIRMARAVGFTFPVRKPIKFSRLFTDRVPQSLVDCIEDLLRYDPKARLTSKDCIEHHYMRFYAPRLRPPQAKPVVSATAPLRPQQVLATNLAASRPIPPSHSTPLSPHANRPPFGAADSNIRPLAMLRQPDGTPLVMVNGGRPVIQAPVPAANAHASPASPMQEDMDQAQWAPPDASMSREVSLSGYPAFPDSASVYSSSAHHDGPPSVAHSSDASSTLVNGPMRLPNGHIDPRHAQTLHAPQHEQYLRHLRQGSDQAQVSDYDGHGAFVPSPGQYASRDMQGYLSATSSSIDLAQQQDPNTSGETISSRDKDKRKSKGWGISSVFGGGGGGGANGVVADNGSAHQYANGSAPSSRRPSNGVASAYAAGNGSHQELKASLEPTPAQRIAAEHATSAAQSNGVPAKPIDPKKAKKEAEKAAREAEKAKREAQQKAARDRARAVMQKRQQILASSNNKDSVEWLAGSVQADSVYRTSPSEKARGKQPAAPGSQLSPPVSGLAPGEFARSPLQPPIHGLSPDYGMNGNPAIAGNMAWRGVGAAIYSRSNKARRREHDDDHSMSSFEDGVEPRRANYAPSIQSYQTGDSDPGPGTGQHGQPGHYVQRASSSSSLASAPPVIDQRRFAPSLESHRSSAETRIISSLDHQLIANMERMTAAEARTRTPGNVSPGPAHLPGPRQSASRSSRTGSRASSTSAHRQGSASPLHHASGIPRFHPYSLGGPGTPSTGYHPPYQLPPLHQSLQQGGVVRGDAGIDAGMPAAYYSNGSHPQQQMHQQHVNPMFHVAPGHGTNGTTLPPFSSIAASIDVPAIDEKATQMLYAQARPSGVLPQN